MFLLIFASLALVGLGLEYVLDDNTTSDNNVEIENENVTETWGQDISLSAEDIIASQTPDQVDVPVDTLDDTSGSNTGTVTVDVDPNTSIEMLATSDGMQAQYGTSGNDLMTGDASRDFLLGSDGNDTLEGGASNDYLFGGQGSDLIEGDAGDDEILTFPVYDEAAVWQDMQQGGSAWGALMHNFDTNYTVSGSDTVYAGQGDDAIFFANGDDIHG